MAEIGCSCGARWTGLSRAHCAASGCHRTFSGVTAFETHQKWVDQNLVCVDPVSVGMEFREDMYRFPQMTEEQKAQRFGGSDGVH